MDSATITSKRQFTIPAKLFKKAGFKIGQKVSVAEEAGKLIITPVEQLIEDLAGSIELPPQWKDKDIDELIEEATEKYFLEHKSKYTK